MMFQDLSVFLWFSVPLWQHLLPFCVPHLISFSPPQGSIPFLKQLSTYIWIGKDPNAGKDRRWEEKEKTGDEMVGWHHRINGHEFEQALGVGYGQGSLACFSPWGCKESDMTEWLNWTDMKTHAVAQSTEAHRCAPGFWCTWAAVGTQRGSGEMHLPGSRQQ